MIAYWSMYVLSLFPEKQGRVYWGFIFVVLTIFIGYRYEVGCDWEQYHYLFGLMSQSFDNAMNVIDPGYGLVNWAISSMGGGVIHVNLVCAALFSAGLITFARHQPMPVLALAIAIPYMVVVVAMGYTRQAVALSFLMMALSYLGGGRNIRFFVFLLIGAVFHKTIVVLLPLGMIGIARGRGITNYLVLGASVWFGVILAIDSAETLWKNYVDAQMESQGAMIRVAMNAVAAVVFLLVRKEWNRRFDDGYLWVWMAWAAIACVPFLNIATTAVDRMALYFLPLQIIVFCRLPMLLSRKSERQLATLGIVAGYAMVMFVWLNFAAHSQCWLPYRSALFQ